LKIKQNIQKEKYVSNLPMIFSYKKINFKNFKDENYVSVTLSKRDLPRADITYGIQLMFQTYPNLTYQNLT
jgi:hypothetical protein